MAFDREARPARPNRGKRRKVCQFCADKCEYIDYKDAAKLRRFVSERSKILPRRTTGTCSHSSASADRGHQARPADRPAALRHRLRQTVTEQRLPHPADGGAFLLQSQFFYAI